MDKYLEYLGRINPFFENKDYTYLIKLLILYVKGKIKDYELISKIKEQDLGVFYTLFNHLINFKDERVKYFIELPDQNFNTSLPKCILVGRLNSYGIFEDFYNVIGPNYMRKTLKFFCDGNLIQINGNLSKIPNGIMLTTSDYFKIISKDPHIYQYMIDLINDPFNIYIKPKDDQEIIAYTKERILKGINSEEKNEPSENWVIKTYQKPLRDDIINSIKTIYNPYQFSIERLLEAHFGTFKSLINEEEPKHAKLIKFPNTKK